MTGDLGRNATVLRSVLTEPSIGPCWTRHRTLSPLCPGIERNHLGCAFIRHRRREL